MQSVHLAPSAHEVSRSCGVSGVDNDRGSSSISECAGACDKHAICGHFKHTSDCAGENMCMDTRTDAGGDGMRAGIVSVHKSSGVGVCASGSVGVCARLACAQVVALACAQTAALVYIDVCSPSRESMYLRLEVLDETTRKSEIE